MRQGTATSGHSRAVSAGCAPRMAEGRAPGWEAGPGPPQSPAHVGTPTQTDPAGTEAGTFCAKRCVGRGAWPLSSHCAGGRPAFRWLLLGAGGVTPSPNRDRLTADILQQGAQPDLLLQVGAAAWPRRAEPVPFTPRNKGSEQSPGPWVGGLEPDEPGGSQGPPGQGI